MKNVKKLFAVKIWFELGYSHSTIVCAFNEKDAINLGIKEGSKLDDCKVISTKVKLLPTCVLRSAFGDIKLSVKPNIYYDDEIIINDTRITLPNEFNYWDIDSIIIHNAGFPVIATIQTKKHTFIVQNNTMGINKRFEIIK